MEQQNIQNVEEAAPVITPNYTEPLPEAPTRETFNLTKRDSVFAILLLIASCFLTIFGIFSGFSGGFTVTAILLFIIATIYIFKSGTKKGVAPFIYGFLSCSTALSFLITGNGTVQFVSFVLMFLLSLVWYKSVSASSKNQNDTSLILNAFAFLFKGCFKNLPKSIVSFFASNQTRRKSILGVLLGLAISLPALLIIVPLLMNSDAAFSGLIENIFGDFFGTVFKLIFGITLGLFIVSYCFTLKKESQENIINFKFGGIYNTPIITFLSVLSVCYFLYLFSQLAYFFSAFKGFLPAGYEFTLSEYARRGFFEMATIAAINLIIIFGVFALSKKENGKLCLAPKILCGFISLFTLVIIATAISKMALYIGSYGMTILRLGTSAFMVFLGIVFLAVIAKLFVNKVKLIKTVLISAGIIVTILGTANINSFVAAYNYHAYNAGLIKEMDVNTIYELGDEGIPYLIKLTESKKAEISDDAKYYTFLAIRNSGHFESDYGEIYENYYYDYVISEKSPDGIGHYNIASQKAKAALQEYIKNNKHQLIIDHNVRFK
jgi:hypothetical protein